MYRQKQTQICSGVESLRWQDLSSHEDLLHQLRQYTKKMGQVHAHVLVLLQFGRVQLKIKKRQMRHWTKSEFI